MSSTNHFPQNSGGNDKAMPVRLGAEADASFKEGWSTIPIPAPRPRVMAHIRDLVLLTGDQAVPLYFGQAAAIGAFRLPSLGASLFGTACRAPLLSEEAENFRDLTQDHVLVVRPDEDATHGCLFTVDILLAHAQLSSIRSAGLWAEAKGCDAPR